MKRWIFLILTIIIIGIFSIVKSCQRGRKEIINVYADKEIEFFVGKIAKKFEREENNVLIKINTLSSIANYDIIFTNDKTKIKDIKKKLEEKDFFEDNLVIIGRRKIDSLAQMLTSTIAVPNYKTEVGKIAIDTLSKIDGFEEMSKKIQYKDDVTSSLQSVDLYEVDYAFVTSRIVPLAKNSEICYIIPENLENNKKIQYKAYIDTENNNSKNFYSFIEEEIIEKEKIHERHKSEKNKVIQTTN